jgi:hypothetical protein
MSLTLLREGFARAANQLDLDQSERQLLAERTRTDPST